MPITQKQANDIYEIIKAYNEMFAKYYYNYKYRVEVKGSKPQNNTLKIYWGKEHFMHLCGIEQYATHPNVSKIESQFSNANQFYEDALEQKLNLGACEVKISPSVEDKVQTKLTLLKKQLKRLRTDIKKLRLDGQSLEFPGIAKQSNMVILFKYSGQSNLVPASVRDSRSKKDYIEYNPKGFVKKLEVFDDQGNLVFEEKNPIPGIKKKSKKRYKKEKKKRLNNRK